MFSQENRLKKTKNFNLTFKKGKKYCNEVIEVKVRKINKNEKKFVFVAPIKDFKKATERNKVKRILREALRENLDNIKSGFNMIFIAKKNILDYSFQEVKKSIEKSLNKFKLLKK